MPPPWAAAVEPRLRLTNAERAALARGLAVTFRATSTPASGAPVVPSNTRPASVYAFATLGTVLLAGLALAIGRPSHHFNQRRS